MIPAIPSDACAIAQATRAGTLSVRSVAEAVAERVAALESAVGAWHVFDPAWLLAQASRLDERADRGPLFGVPIAVKDVIETSDLPTGYGSLLYDGHQPAADASCVALLRAAGALIVGKTVSTEFAFIAPGKTTHPANPAHTPGGSSSGSAACVAAGMVPVALGTQTSGSTIRPAAFCGIVGYKPSFGLIDRTGIKTLADSLDTIGLLARSVQDVGLVAACLAGRPELAEATTLAAPRFVIFRTPQWAQADPDAQQMFERNLEQLAAAGAVLTELDDPDDHVALLAAHDTVMRWEVPRALAHERLAGADRLQPRTRDGIQPTPGLDAFAYDAARRLAAHARGLWAEALTGFDALLTLPASGEAPLGLASTGNPIFNRAWTQLRLPCITVPAGHGATGLPLGLQLVGRFNDDARLLAAARMAEATVHPLQA